MDSMKIPIDSPQETALVQLICDMLSELEALSFQRSTVWTLEKCQKTKINLLASIAQCKQYEMITETRVSWQICRNSSFDEASFCDLRQI